MSDDVEKQAAVGAGAAVLGAAAGLLAQAAPAIHAHGRGTGVPKAAFNFSAATSHALKHHKHIVPALGAGMTAAVGGPAVVTAAVAAAPVVAGVAIVGAVGAGIAWMFGAFED